MIIIDIILVIIIFILIYYNKKGTINEKQENYINLDNYTTNNYVMTQTELIFYRELIKVTNKLDLSIFPQVNLERIINVKDNNNRDRNRIKSRSIDYCIVNNKNCKVICCIELDDYTHNREKSKINDEFKNKLFEKVKIPLHRIKVSNFYDLEQIEQIIKADLQVHPTL